MVTLQKLIEQDARDALYAQLEVVVDVLFRNDIPRYCACNGCAMGRPPA